MRALQLTGWQQDPEYREVPDPEPRPGEVVVRIGGAGVCHSDLHMLYEFPPGAMSFNVPFTLGHENAGWVERVGAGVVGLEQGQPVAVYGPSGCGRCHRCRQGMENYCERSAEMPTAGLGLGSDGGMAPLLLVPSARLLVPLTDLEPADAAPLTDAGLTPYHAIKRSLTKLIPGSSVVVVGVGGLGHMAVQLLKAMTGSRVIAVDQREEALTLARDAGADETVAAGEQADQTAAEVRDATRGKGADVVLDFVGSDATVALGVQTARPLADLTVVGIAGGSYPFSFFTVPYEVTLATTYWGSVTELMEVIALAEAGHIKAHVERFPLDKATDAYQALREGRLEGRAVVVP